MTQDQPIPSHADRRARPRSPIVVQEVRVSCEHDVFFGCALNVSRSGLFISTVLRRAPGEVHEIRFRLPGIDHVFICRATVLWVRAYTQGSPVPPGFGLQFLDLTQSEVALIDRWVAAAEPDGAAE